MERSLSRRFFGTLPWSRFVPAMILMLGVGLFVLAEMKSRATDRINVQNTLELRADWRAMDYASKIATLVEPVDALALLISSRIASGAAFGAEDFRRFARDVRGTNPVARLTWSPRVKGGDRAEFEEAARRSGAVDYVIRTPDGDNPLTGVPAPQQEAYVPVLFEANFSGLRAVFGYDILGNPVRRAAAERARDEGRSVSTPPFRPIGAAEVGPYFTVFLPVYRGDGAPLTVDERRERLLGFVTGTYLLRAVMEFAIRDTPTMIEKLSLFIDHADVVPSDIPLVVFDPDSGSVEVGHDQLGDPLADGLRLIRRFEAMGHPRTMVFDFSPEVLSSLQAASWTDLILGMTLMLSIAVYIAIEQHRRKTVEAVVAARTRDLADINEELRRENEGRRIAQADLLRTGDQLQVMIDEERRTAQQLSAVVNNAVDGLINIGERGVIEAFNPACERIFGYAAAEVIGHNIRMLMPEPYHSAHDGYIDRYLTTGEAQIIGTTGREVRAKRKDGSTFPMDLAIGAFTLADGRHFCGIIRDITERQAAQAELLRTGDQLKAMADEARQSALLLSAVVDNAVDGLINIGELGVIEAFNPACERMFGYAAAEVIGQNIKMLMPEPYHSAHDGYIDRYLTTGEAQIIGTTGREVRAKRKDGSTFPMDLAIGAFTLADGRHFCGIIRDITERRKGEETMELLAAIVASSDDAILSKTTEGIITSWNVGAERLFGYSAREAIGRHISLIISPDRLQEEVSIIEQIMAGISIEHYETVRIHKDGHEVCISASISPIRDKAGHIVGAAKVARDIAVRKRHEAELARQVHALERSNKELDDFAYIASHDLKEPLRGLFNNAKFLHEDYADKLDQDGVNRLARLRYLCQRMEQLINDLLYFSRLGRQDLAVQPTDLNAVIRDIEAMSETTLQGVQCQHRHPRSRCRRYPATRPASPRCSGTSLPMPSNTTRTR